MMTSPSGEATRRRAIALLQLRREEFNRLEAAQGLVRLQQAPILAPTQARRIMLGTVPDEMFYSDSDAATVLSAMLTQNPNSQLRDALLYLEHHEFNVAIAIQGFELDTIDRAEAPVKPGSANEVHFQMENTQIDRSLALPGPAFDRSKLKISVIQNGKLKTRTFAGVRTFDKTNIGHVKALNKWRHEQIRTQVARAIKNASGERYHPLEVTFLEESFMNAALRMRETHAADYKKNVDYKSITQQHKNYFAGHILPGRYEPAQERSQSSISGFWIRQYSDKQRRGTNHLEAGMALRDSGKFKARRIKMLKAMGRYHEATKMDAQVSNEYELEKAGERS